MNGRTTRRAAVVAVVAALGVTLTASPALAKSAARCPQQAGQTCKKIDKRPVVVPKQAKPKIQPALVKDRYGHTAYRSGSWFGS